MQTVSAAWKENQQQAFTSEGLVEVSFDITDPDALADASSQDNGSAYLSDSSKVVSEIDRDIVPYSTLEQNLWVLDGSRKTLPSGNTEYCGFVGDVLSGENCGFSHKIPTINVNFTKVHHNHVPAVTIVWGAVFGEFAEDFIVRVYNGDSVVVEKEVVGNRSVRSVVAMDIVDYDRITISILRWCLPHHRARVEEIFVGLNRVFTKSELFGFSHTQMADPISTSLPKAEISFAVDNMDDSYNPNNENGMVKYLLPRQEMRTRYGSRLDGGRIEWIQGGTFYLSEWGAAQNGIEADFTARDILEFLTDKYRDDVTTITSRSLYSIAEAILTSSNLPVNSDGGKKWIIDDSLKKVYTTAPMPDDTKANCLLLIANAGQCVLYQDRNGVLHIEPIGDAVSDDYAITSFNSYTKPEMTIGRPIRGINVKQYTYTVGDKGIESTTSEVGLMVNEIGEMVEIDNPLVTDYNTAAAICDWMWAYLQKRTTINASWRPDVRLDVLDKIIVRNPYGDREVRMTNIKYQFGGAFRGTAEGRES